MGLREGTNLRKRGAILGTDVPGKYLRSLHKMKEICKLYAVN